jgi:hypothetical protein
VFNGTGVVLLNNRDMIGLDIVHSKQVRSKHVGMKLYSLSL